ncbi:MAG: hypothetical protein AB1758_27565 [Candidatus Eremiobacterota bacterium]
MEPAFQHGLALAVAVALNPDLGMTAYLQANNYSNEVSFQQGIGLLPQPDGQLGSGGGLVGGTFFQGSHLKKVGEDALVYSEQFGETATELHFSRTEQGTRVTGHLGDVPATLEVQFYLDDQGLHIESNGTVGGQPYQLRTDALGEQWLSRGSLGGVAISKDYRAEQESSEGSQRLTVRGGGDNAGMPQSVNVALEFRKPG